MIAALRVLWRLLVYRPTIPVLLLFVYAVAALLLFTIAAHSGGVAIAALAGFGAGALTALFTDRIKTHALHASAIALPDHARVMRRVQACFLLLFAAVPAVGACLLGAEPLAALAAMVTAAAAGILVGGYRAGGWLLLVPVLGRVLPLADWAALPAVQALAVAIGAYVIWRWFDLPLAMERAATLAGARLADAGHEQTNRLRRPKNSAPEESTSEPADELRPFPATTDIDSGRRLPAVLALGLGYSLRIGWRGVLYGAAIATAVLAGAQALHISRPAVPPYLIVTGFCCVARVGRLQIILQRWKQTATEQALLRLTPAWPEARSIKRAVLATTVLIQRGSIVVWAAASAVAALLGWIDGTALFTGLLAVVGTSLASSGALWAILAHRRIREWHFSTIGSVLIVGAGALTIFFGAHAPGHLLAAGAGLMMAPPALALAWYTLAPLRLPLNVDPQALKGTL
jgi:hypothetical protein